MERSNRPRRTLGALRAELVFSGESLRINGRGLLLGLVVGLLVGAWGGLFARLLEGAALVRQQTTWAMFLLPLAGIVVVWLYRRGGIKTAGGTDLIIQAARGEQPVSRLLAPVIFLATLLTHCFGGSAGREGAALQLGGSLAEFVRKGVRMGEEFQDLAIMCGMSAGFSAVFGSQITAALFALEISCVGMLPLGALFPNPYLRVVAGSVGVILLTLMLGSKEYLGTGDALIYGAIHDGQADPVAFAWKILFTALTLGCGLKGGEIVPSFAIGATFGCVVGPLLGLPAPYAAGVGMISMFCGVTNCPLSALVLGFEVFSFCNPGGFLMAVAASFLVSGYGGLYAKQKFAFSKRPDSAGLGREDRQDREESF